MVALVVTGLIPSPIGAQAQTDGCSLATLQGSYIWGNSGFTIEDGEQVPFAYAGRETYDGAGNMEGVYSGSWNGEIYRSVSYTGTYEVNADCTGVLETIDEHTGNFYFTNIGEGEVTQGFNQRAQQ